MAKKKHQLWTPESKAELRKKLPEKLNAFGEAFFAQECGKPFLIIKDRKAILK
ncbi:MAG: hypothetical protein LUC26_06350 [Prevotella sp.]|nr:hypothetical protein [Prevotella sp.]MCD8289517.1 hypothetical protein [Prevotella sp.]